MSKKQVMAEIIRHTSLSDGIFDMTLKAEEIAKEAKAGQFISVYLNNKSKILPRPISICGIDKEAGTLRIVYRTVGDGTKELSDYKEGEMVKILGPLGNGFTQKDKKSNFNRWRNRNSSDVRINEAVRLRQNSSFRIP